MATATKAKKIGKVVHYYDKIGVAIVDLAKPIKVGDTVLFQRGELEFAQPIDSMEVEHETVAKAKKGDVVGLKVDQPVKEGTLVSAA